MSWCLDLLHYRLTPAEIKTKFTALERYARETFPETGCVDLAWLGAVVRKIDELWYDDRLVKSLDRVYGGVELTVTVSDPKVAGYVWESEDGSHISLHMNRDLFAALFAGDEHGYHSGGLLCRDKLVCLLHVLLHETVHLVLTLCDRLNLRRDVRHHGKDFNRIVKNLFGQTDSQHGFLPGYNQYHSMEELRALLRPGLPVEMLLEGEWQPAVVKIKGRKFATVTCKTRRYKVNHGLLRIPK